MNHLLLNNELILFKKMSIFIVNLNINHISVKYIIYLYLKFVLDIKKIKSRGYKAASLANFLSVKQVFPLCHVGPTTHKSPKVMRNMLF
jgi:hypothetical protein